LQILQSGLTVVVKYLRGLGLLAVVVKYLRRSPVAAGL